MDRQDEVIAAAKLTGDKAEQGTATQAARHAAADLADALVALQQARALFAAIETAAARGDKEQPFLLAQVGKEISGGAEKRTEESCDFFAEATR